jgi:hypothetical protein
VSSSGVAWRRQYQRYAHLLVATWLGVYVYSPLGDGALFGLLTQAVAFPFLVASGLLLWKGRALRRWVAPSRRRPSR